MSITEIIAASEEPITLADLKNALKLENDDDLSHLQNSLISARHALEQLYDLSFVNRTLRLTLDKYPDRIILPNPPAASIVEMRVRDSLTTFLTIDLTKLLLTHNKLVFYELPPEPFTQNAGIEIDFVAGFGTAAQVPPSIKHAVRLLACHYYQYRGAVGGAPATHKLPQQVRDLMSSYKIYRI